MLKDYPIKFNTWALPFMPTFKQKSVDVVNKYTSEGGRDEEQVILKDKLSLDISATVLEDVLRQLYAYKNLEHFTLSKYDVITQSYKTYNVRFKDNSFNYSLVKNSDKISVSNGIYKVSFTIEEF